MSKFALVSTVGTIGDGFPCHCVMLFETEEDAVRHAVDLILGAYAVDVSDGLFIGTEKFTDPKKFLAAWQNNLELSEYFDVMPVLPVKATQKEQKQMSEQDDGGPAFPVPRDAPVDGMSLRDYFAAKAMAAMLSLQDVHFNNGESEVAVWSYQQADAMLKQRIPVD